MGTHTPHPPPRMNTTRGTQHTRWIPARPLTLSPRPPHHSHEHKTSVPVFSWVPCVVSSTLSLLHCDQPDEMNTPACVSSFFIVSYLIISDQLLALASVSSTLCFFVSEKSVQCSLCHPFPHFSLDSFEKIRSHHVFPRFSVLSSLRYWIKSLCQCCVLLLASAVQKSNHCPSMCFLATP